VQSSLSIFPEWDELRYQIWWRSPHSERRYMGEKYYTFVRFYTVSPLYSCIACSLRTRSDFVGWWLEMRRLSQGSAFCYMFELLLKVLVCPKSYPETHPDVEIPLQNSCSVDSKPLNLVSPTNFYTELGPVTYHEAGFSSLGSALASNYSRLSLRCEFESRVGR